MTAEGVLRGLGSDGRMGHKPVCSLRSLLARHGRACPGHPRLSCRFAHSGLRGNRANAGLASGARSGGSGTRLAVELLAAEIPNRCGCQGRTFQARRRAAVAAGDP